MCYLFKSLKSNRLLNAGDTIALGVPIFTPYLEMPHLEDYALEIVEIRARQENHFQFTDDELDKLLDPKIKAFFVCNPGNPSAMALSNEVIAKIGQILDKRPDLILLTDDVYGTFVQVSADCWALSRKTPSVFTHTANISAARVGGSGPSRCTR